jgi:hypothetical protein
LHANPKPQWISTETGAISECGNLDYLVKTPINSLSPSISLAGERDPVGEGYGS